MTLELIMSEVQNLNTEPESDGDPVREHTSAWHAMIKLFKERGFENYVTENSLRLTASGNVRLDMKHFMTRKDVQKLIQEARELSADPGLPQRDISQHSEKTE